jgi:hypothetical protein
VCIPLPSNASSVACGRKLPLQGKPTALESLLLEEKVAWQSHDG